MPEKSNFSWQTFFSGLAAGSLFAFFLTASISLFSTRMRNLRLSELQQLGQQGLEPVSAY